MNLRPYQADLLNRTKTTLAGGSKAPLVVAPTGAGKTVLFSTIADGAKAKKNRVLILVHRREILEQTLKALHRLGVTCGQIAAGRPMTSDPIQVAMVQTAVRRIGQLHRPDLIIVDEAHHAVAGSWETILNYWSTVPRIGFTASPIRLDGTGLRGTFDTIIEGPTIRSLVADGWLSVPVLYRPPNEITQKFHVKRGDFDAGEQQAVMTQKAIVGDVIAHYRKHLDGLPTIVSCVSIEHARIMADQFTEAGYRARVVWGDMPTDEREAAIQGLADGSVQLVTFCDLITEGVDVPVIAGVIMLRRTLSLSLYLQIVGRALRPYPGKSRAIILDHAGNFHLHGHVLQDRVWSLDGQKRKKDERPPQTTTCPKCYGVWPGVPKTCPACGHQFEAPPPERERRPIKVIEGELIEAGVEQDAAEDMAVFVARAMEQEAKKRQAMLLGKAFDLLTQGDEGKRKVAALAAAVGYKESWTQWAWQYVQKNSR